MTRIPVQDEARIGLTIRRRVCVVDPTASTECATRFAHAIGADVQWALGEFAQQADAPSARLGGALLGPIVILRTELLAEGRGLGIADDALEQDEIRRYLGAPEHRQRWLEHLRREGRRRLMQALGEMLDGEG